MKKFSFMDSENTYHADTASEAIGVAMAELSSQMAILINPQVFLEEPLFGHRLKEWFDKKLFTTELARESGFKLMLLIPDTDTAEKAKIRAVKLSEAAMSIGSFLDLEWFAAILAETSPQDVIDAVINNHFSRIGVLLGPNTWIQNYIGLRMVKNSSSIGAVVDLSPLSSETYNYATGAFMAAFLAALNSGIIPDNFTPLKIKVRQEGQIIWAPVIHPSEEYLKVYRAMKRVMAEALFLDV